MNPSSRNIESSRLGYSILARMLKKKKSRLKSLERHLKELNQEESLTIQEITVLKSNIADLEKDLAKLVE